MDELAYLNEKLRDEMNNRADTIIDGGLNDIEEYRHETGIIKGLAMAERMLKDIQDARDRDED